MKQMTAAIALLVGLGLAGSAAHATPIAFTTFVASSDIAAVEGGNQSTIAFNYTGTGFVGSVYFGPDNNQLYSTNLTGGNVQQYGQPISGFSGEVVIGVGLGQAGFAKGAVYAGNGGGNQIDLVPASGSPVLFGSVQSGEAVRQIFFDPGSTFGGKMLVSTNDGRIYSFDSLGNRTLIASTGEDTEGMDIAPSTWGTYAGDLLTTSEGSGTLRAITPGGTVTTIATGIPLAETVSAVPLGLNNSNSIEGFYVANYPENIQFADANQFINAGILGDVIVTSEEGANAQVWDVHDSGGSFAVTQIGTLPNQSEDGIFVTAQRVKDFGVPEPASLFLLASGLGAMAAIRRRKRPA